MTGGLLGYIQLKSSLLDSDAFLNPLRNGMARLPFGEETLFLTAQILTLAIAATTLWVYRQPRILWLYLAGHIVWFVSVGLVVLGQQSLIDSTFDNAVLVALFFEPSFALVVVIVASCLQVTKWKSRETILVAVLLVLSLLAELSAIVALDAFVSALAGLMMMN